ncbi:helix-turn-helix domain-containing protein [Flavitalea sp.]|nr:helix-turn-helix domain-containing protein [Flavitalea sp.]
MENILLIPVPIDAFFERMQEIVQAQVRAEVKAVLAADSEAKLISSSEACKIFRPAISKTTLWRWAKDGRITVHRIGGSTYYKALEIEEAAKHLKKFKAV